jgi:hypothetical protein
LAIATSNLSRCHFSAILFSQWQLLFTKTAICLCGSVASLKSGKVGIIPQWWPIFLTSGQFASKGVAFPIWPLPLLWLLPLFLAVAFFAIAFNLFTYLAIASFWVLVYFVHCPSFGRCH